MNREAMNREGTNRKTTPQRHILNWQRMSMPVSIEPSEIEPGKGVGLLRFGMTPTQVRRALGRPTLFWRDEAGDQRAIYDRQGLALDFPADESFRLTAIQVLAPNASLERRRLATMNQDQVRAAFEKLGFAFYNPESGFGGQEEWWTTSQGPGSLIVRFDDARRFIAVITTVAFDEDGKPGWQIELPRDLQ